MTDKSEFGTAANYYVSEMYRLAKSRDLNTQRLLAVAGLEASVIDRPKIRIPTEKLANFQKAIWAKLGDESMGLAGCKLPTGTYYMMGQLTVHQQTLQQALELGARFYNLVTRQPLIELGAEGESAVLSVRPPQPELDRGHLFAEISLLALHRYASWLIADSLPLSEARFPYEAPGHVKEYSYLFPGEHKFSQSSLSLVFPAKYLSRQVKQNDASLKSFMNRCPLELFRRYKADYSLAAELKRIIASNLSSGKTSIEHSAAILHMTPRTLIRHLKEEGTSFQQLKNLVRRDKAIQLLSHPSLGINDVAERVGFSDPAAFTRAFRSWTGESPKGYRARFFNNC